MVNKEIRKKLYILAEKAYIYYKKKENVFIGEPQINQSIPRETRIKLIETLIDELSQIPILKTDQGITLDVFSEHEALGLLSLITHDLTAGLLRGYGKGKALYKADCPYINKWVPLVMYALKEKHGLKYEDFWLKGNPYARLLLGKELKDLTVKIKEEELIKLYKSQLYAISGLGYKLKRPRNIIDDGDEEQVEDMDEDRVDYNDKATRVIRPHSPLLSVYNNEYPQNYGIFKDCLSKELMLELIWHYIIKSNKVIEEWDGKL